MSKEFRPLENGYTKEIDSVNKHDWCKIIDNFADSNLYQSWDYDVARCGEENISHIVLRFAGKIVAAAQARIIRVPFLGIGAAYVRWAPIWQIRNQPPNTTNFRMALRALRNEYVSRRGLLLRVFPILYEEDSCSYTDILSQEGYVLVREESRARTLVMDISQPLDDIRKNFDQKWRNCLNKSERNNLEVIEGNDDRLFAEFIDIYRAMLKRKMFLEPSNIDEFKKIQHRLPAEHKMRIFICRANGINSAGVICANIGETGIYLFGATNVRGLTNKGSYLLQWKAIQWLKESGCKKYNLNGINPTKNPGSYHFKAGLSGRNGSDVHYLGRFDFHSGGVFVKLVRAVDVLLPRLKMTISRMKISRR